MTGIHSTSPPVSSTVPSFAAGSSNVVSSTVTSFAAGSSKIVSSIGTSFAAGSSNVVSSTASSFAAGSSNVVSSTASSSTAGSSNREAVQHRGGRVHRAVVHRFVQGFVHGGVRGVVVRLAALLLVAAVLGVAVAVGTPAVVTAGPAAAGPTVTEPSPAPAPGAPMPSPIPAPPTGGAAGTEGSNGDANSDSGDDPGLFDIPGQIRKAIDEFLLWVAKTALHPVLDALGHTILSTPDLTGNTQIKALWTASLITANGIFALFVMAGGFIVAARESMQTRYGLKEIAPRIAVAGVAANLSLILCGQIINAVNALTAAIAGQGVDPGSAATAIEQMLDQPLTPGNTPPVLFSLLMLAALVMAVVAVVTFLLRTAALALLIGLGPLALTCHATPQTEGLAYTWWRAVGACLGIQIGQAVIVLGTVKVFLTPAGKELFGVPATTGGLVGLLLCVTMLWLVLKLPGWMRHFVLGPLGHSRGLIGQVIHAVFMLKTLGALAGITTATSRAAGAGGTRTGSAGGGVARRSAVSATRPGGARPGRSPRPPRPGRPRTTPPPAGPAAFSHAPTVHTLLPGPAGTTSPGFSHPPVPGTPIPAPAGGVPPARFSHPTGPQPAPPTSPRPGPAVFRSPAAASRSSTRGSSTASRPTRPAPAATFSSAPRPQVAPERPPAPVTPIFTAPSNPAAPSSRATSSSPRSSSRAVSSTPGVVSSTPASSTPGRLVRSRPTPAPPSTASSTPSNPSSNSPSDPTSGGRAGRRRPRGGDR